MASGEIGSFTILRMLCGAGLTVFAEHKRGFIIPVCIFHEDLSLQLFRECAPRRQKRLFFLFALAHFRASFFVFLCLHTHTFSFEMHAHEETRPEAKGQKTMMVSARGPAVYFAQHLIAAFIIIFCSHASLVVIKTAPITIQNK